MTATTTDSTRTPGLSNIEQAFDRLNEGYKGLNENVEHWQPADFSEDLRAVLSTQVGSLQLAVYGRPDGEGRIEQFWALSRVGDDGGRPQVLFTEDDLASMPQLIYWSLALAVHLRQSMDASHPG